MRPRNHRRCSPVMHEGMRAANFDKCTRGRQKTYSCRGKTTPRISKSWRVAVTAACDGSQFPRRDSV
jgi:hypothetical protein